MGLFDDLFRKHGHKKHKDTQDLLEIIKRLETNLTMQNREIFRLTRDNEKLYRDLQRCLRSKPKPHGAKFDVVFP